MRSIILGGLSLILMSVSFTSYCYHSTELIKRNPYSIDNSVESEHFVIYWGSGIDESKLQLVLDNFEHSWDVLIEQKGFENPPTTDVYKLNVYLSGTGQPVWDDVTGGFAILDPQGHEAIILNKNVLTDDNALIIGPTHEFFHTIQSAYGLIYSDAMLRISWLVESTANWSFGVVWPDSDAIVRNSLSSFAFYPQYAIDQDEFDSSLPEFDLLAGHHYGSYILFEHLAEVTQDEDIVKRYFEYLAPIVSETKNKHALVELREFTLLTYGLSFEDLFFSFAERNTRWEYPNQSDILAAFNDWRSSHTDEHIAQNHVTIDNQWHDSPSDKLPRRLAANYIRLGHPDVDQLEVGFAGSSHGTQGGIATWRVSVVTERDDGISYTELPLQASKIEKQLVSISGANAIWLAIMVTSDSQNLHDKFAYRYQFALPGQSQNLPSTPIEVDETPANSQSGSLGFFIIGVVFLLGRLVKR